MGHHDVDADNMWHTDVRWQRFLLFIIDS